MTPTTSLALAACCVCPVSNLILHSTFFCCKRRVPYWRAGVLSCDDAVGDVSHTGGLACRHYVMLNVDAVGDGRLEADRAQSVTSRSRRSRSMRREAHTNSSQEAHAEERHTQEVPQCNSSGRTRSRRNHTGTGSLCEWTVTSVTSQRYVTASVTSPWYAALSTLVCKAATYLDTFNLLTDRERWQRGV